MLQTREVEGGLGGGANARRLHGVGIVQSSADLCLCCCIPAVPLLFSLFFFHSDLYLSLYLSPSYPFPFLSLVSYSI